MFAVTTRHHEDDEVHEDREDLLRKTNKKKHELRDGAVVTAKAFAI